MVENERWLFFSCSGTFSLIDEWIHGLGEIKGCTVFGCRDWPFCGCKTKWIFFHTHTRKWWGVKKKPVERRLERKTNYLFRLPSNFSWQSQKSNFSKWRNQTFMIFYVCAKSNFLSMDAFLLTFWWWCGWAWSGLVLSCLV